MLNPTRSEFDDLISEGYGLVASLIGGYTSVYRLNGRTSGAMVSAQTRIYNMFPAQFELAARGQIESLTFDLKILQGKCDTRYIAFGDILVDNATGERYCYAQRRIFGSKAKKLPLFARVERMATISRPNAEIDDNPAPDSTPTETGWELSETSGGDDIYAGRTDATDAILSLARGQFSFGSSTLAQIPVGLQPIARVSDTAGKDFAENVGRTRFLMYIPPLPGVELQRLDRVDLGDTSYEIAMVYVGMSGFFGNVCVVSEDLTP